MGIFFRNSKRWAAGAIIANPLTMTAKTRMVISSIASFDALFGKLFLGNFALLKMRQTHALQNFGRFGVLDIAILDDLDPVAPWIEEIKKVAFEHGGPGSAG